MLLLFWNQCFFCHCWGPEVQYLICYSRKESFTWTYYSTDYCCYTTKRPKITHKKSPFIGRAPIHNHSSAQSWEYCFSKKGPGTFNFTWKVLTINHIAKKKSNKSIWSARKNKRQLYSHNILICILQNVGKSSGTGEILKHTTHFLAPAWRIIQLQLPIILGCTALQ